jgi:hypothetical protein
VVRRMFADIDAEVYFLVDGDDTYDADAAVDALTSLMNEGLDFVNIARVTRVAGAYRRGHRLGNAWLTGVVRLTFGHRFTDMLSGYKVFSRRFVKSFPALSRGFEIETELTIHALELRMPSTEIQAHYRERIEGSTSKLRTIRDGVRILALIIRLLRDERPLWFFGAIGVMGILAAIGLAVPVITTYLESGLVPRLPTALLSVGLILSGLQSIAVGLVLETVRTGRREARHLAYLRFCGPVLPD